jgi:branched-chain amino acid transport system substrate-binding protein
MKFIEGFKAKYGTLPDDVAALTYDSFGLLFQALKSATKLDRDSIRDALAKIPKYEGVTGNMQFKEGSGDPTKSAVIVQIKGGKFVYFATANP